MSPLNESNFSDHLTTNEVDGEEGTWKKMNAAQDNHKNNREGLQQNSDHCDFDIRRSALRENNRGFIVHDDTGGYTTEGFGSHARSCLFPLVHIALATQLVPVFSNEGLARNRARDYAQLDVAGAFGFNTRFTAQQLTACFTDENNKRIIHVNTWSDPNLGSACGDAKVLAQLLNDHLLSSGANKKNGDDGEPWLIVLYGCLKYMDPTPRVHHWLQERSLHWKEQLYGPNDYFRVAIHIRVPEEWCPQFWKDANHVDKFASALEVIYNSTNPTERKGGDNQSNPLSVKVDVFTEDRFPVEAETDLQLICRPDNIVCTIYRGSSASILTDLQTMSCADILVASSSHFSAMAGYLCTSSCLIVPVDHQNEYFEPHSKALGCTVLPIGHPCLPNAIQKRYSAVLARIKKAKQVCG
jgi:hypothetical protein